MMAEVHDVAHEESKKARADMIKNNDARIAYDARQRPTPTPEELLAAHSGKNVDVKEPSGAVPQDPTDPEHMRLDPHLRKEGTKRERVASAEGHDASYQTRTSHADSSAGKSK
jgi:hypothetical protein